MNVIQKIIFFIGLLVFVTSIVFIPIRVTEYKDGKVNSEWLEFKFIVESKVSEEIEIKSETIHYYGNSRRLQRGQDNESGSLTSSTTTTTIADQKYRASDYQTWVIILFAELVLFGGLIYLTKSKEKGEVKN